MDILQYEFMQRAFLAGGIVALLCPLVGMFVVVRRQSLLGDGLGHVAFAGVTGSALFGIYPPLGAIALTVLAAIGIEWVRRKHSQYSDMGLALFFYAGLALAVIFSSLARMPYTGIMSFLFGSILTVTGENIIGMGIVSVIVLFTLYKLYPSLLLSSFDADIAIVNGVETERMNLIFSVMVAAVVVVGMTIVGILLISALMIIPVASAHLWQKGFRSTSLIAVIYSFIMIFIGLFVSYQWDLAPGGTIVLTGLIAYAITSLVAWQMTSRPSLQVK